MPATQSTDSDPLETREWLESLEAVVRVGGRERGLFLLERLEDRAQELGMAATRPPYSAYRNTISLEQQVAHPGDVALEERISALVRWNALAMVVRANRAYRELGGHIASYASAAEIFEVGFNHFFRGPGMGTGGDLVFFQPHSAPGIYARAFLEGRIGEDGVRTGIPCSRATRSTCCYDLPLDDQDLENLQFYRPAKHSPEMVYLRDRRAALGGSLPARQRKAPPLAIPPIASYAAFALQAENKAMSTTMAVVRLFSALLRDKVLGPRIVPIVADEARTFGMASLFRQLGIYSPAGQLYEPEDASSLLSYKESRDGQLLEEGITEAGAMSTWVAAATSYSVHGLSLLPFYIYYSMFGFQRVGDLIWAAADQRARGFLIGATAGRTTLGGEGLQHQDGSSHVVAATIPNCRAFDPAFAGELAVIIDHGARQMLERGEDEFYYLTVMNENYAQPSLPSGSEAGVIRGMYRFCVRDAERALGAVRLLGSGAILREVIAASVVLTDDWHISSEVWSVTSFSELAREAREYERWNRLHPGEAPRCSYLAECLEGAAPIVAATDYVRAYPQLIASYVRARFIVLGTDGFGRSDTRVALRRFFEIDRYHIALAALQSLVEEQSLPCEVLASALGRYNIDGNSSASWIC